MSKWRRATSSETQHRGPGALTEEIRPIYVHREGEQAKAYKSNGLLDKLHETYKKTKCVFL